jgi:hypothetical protein
MSMRMVRKMIRRSSFATYESIAAEPAFQSAIHAASGNEMEIATLHTKHLSDFGGYYFADCVVNLERMPSTTCTSVPKIWFSMHRHWVWHFDVSRAEDHLTSVRETSKCHTQWRCMLNQIFGTDVQVVDGILSRFTTQSAK